MTDIVHSILEIIEKERDNLHAWQWNVNISDLRKAHMDGQLQALNVIEIQILSYKLAVEINKSVDEVKEYISEFHKITSPEVPKGL